VSAIADWYKSQYGGVANDAATANGIPPDLFNSLITFESGWNPNNPSSKGAIGFGQLMPGTASDLGVNPFDPTQNLQGSAAYLGKQLSTFGNIRDALAAYEAGPGNIKAGYANADKILKMAGMDANGNPADTSAAPASTAPGMASPLMNGIQGLNPTMSKTIQNSSFGSIWDGLLSFLTGEAANATLIVAGLGVIVLGSYFIISDKRIAF
jgi:hypothetical protein